MEPVWETIRGIKIHSEVSYIINKHSEIIQLMNVSP